MKINTALILCAGLGKRLNPITLKTPKPLIKLNDIPILETCIDTIIKSGFKKILINTFHLREQICNFIKLRNSQHAQKEIREIAQQMWDLVATIDGEPFKYTLNAIWNGRS